MKRQMCGCNSLVFAHTVDTQAVLLALLVLFCLPAALQAQVDYHDSGEPWNQRADSGPDAEVPGWFYNLGITGLRVQLMKDDPKSLLVKYVFPDSPASKQIKAGDRITGADNKPFLHEHRNGYGMKVFGFHGPIAEFADALEAGQGDAGKGQLYLTLRRGGENRNVVLDVGQKYGTYSATYPDKCPKSDLILSELLDYLVAHQDAEGSFGDPMHNTFAPLALLASGETRYMPAVEHCVRYFCKTTQAKDRRVADLINWHYMGHNPGFEGYGPIAMLTGQGALAYSLMHRCGIKIDRTRHDAAYKFLKKATGANGYVWYKDEVGGAPLDWADMGRTGAAGIANFMSPYPEPVYRERALLHSKVIGEHPQSFPDTHGSPPMGMAYTALAANIEPANFRKLMDANRGWFTLAQCTDGSFYYQPNRDNAGYGSDARMTASSVVAFIFTLPKHSLAISGRK